MKEKVTHLTEAKLKEIIYESVITTMNEADAAAYSRAHKATNPARKDNNNEIYVHQVNSTKQEKNDDIITHGIDLKPQAADSMISPYKSTRYMFYCRNLRQNTGIVLFSLTSLYELTDEEAILEGDIIFNNQQMKGRIIVNLGTGNVEYHHNSTRRKYQLEIDNRFAAQWNELIGTLQKASK